MTRLAWLPLLVACGPKTVPALPYSFAAYGDCRHYHKVHANLCDAMVRSGAKFVLVSGDLVDHGDREDQWVRFREITKDLRARAEYLPAMGDHDGKLFPKEFGLEKLYYDRVIGDVHVFVLDSTKRFGDAEQLAWLEDRAAASKSLHRMAVFHHPPFTIDPDRQPGAEEIRGRIHWVLVKHRFCAAWTGHDHGFYTTARDGVRYVVTAGGGASLFEPDPSKGRPGDLWKSFYHFVGCRIEGRRIAAQVIDEDGDEVPALAFTVCDHP
ncbi:MAG: metallophosphoesterase [Planctomycetes bacterium]|nr:metallophosphoesterase [Planctomycetota bacterium]